MPAIAKLAVTDHLTNLTKPVLNLLWPHVPETKLPNTRRINQITAHRQVKKLRSGSGMDTLASTLGNCTHTNCLTRHQRLNNRRLTNPRLTHKSTGFTLHQRLNLRRRLTIELHRRRAHNLIT